MTKPEDLVTINDGYEDLEKYIKMFTRHAVLGVVEAKQHHQQYEQSGDYNDFQIALDYMQVTQAQNILRVSINAAIINYFFDRLTEKRKDD